MIGVAVVLEGMMDVAMVLDRNDGCRRSFYTKMMDVAVVFRQT